MHLILLSLVIALCSWSGTTNHGVRTVSSYTVLTPSKRQSRYSSLAGAASCSRSSWLSQPTNGGFCRSRTFYLSSSSSSERDSTDEFVDAQDLEGIQALFTKYCDSEGLMTKQSLSQVAYIADLLKEEDLLQEELNDIWNAVPKFPDITDNGERIDVDSFVRIYRDIDNLFEDLDDDEDDDEKDQKDPEKASSDNDTKQEETVATQQEDDEEDDDDDDEEEEELESVFESISNTDGLLAKQALQNWSEIQKLLEDGLLGQDEFDDIWEKTPKRPGSNDSYLDVDGFLSFNVALDSLFEFDDEDSDEVEDEDEEVNNVAASKNSDDQDNMSPSMLFYTIADEETLSVGMKELKQWDELNDMLSEGDISQEEVQTMFADITKKLGIKTLNEAGFVQLYEQIDDLFEDDDDDDAAPSPAPVPQATQKTTTSAATSESDASDNTWKKELLRSIDIIETRGDEDGEERLPCGLESTEKEQERILNIVTELEKQPSLNLVRSTRIEKSDIAGTWKLLYTSSSAMRFNQGLSGIGGSFPNGKFDGLTQTLTTTKFVSDVEYSERIAVVPEAASFDVIVDGNWDLRSSVSIFTGQPSLVVTVVPNLVSYMGTSTKGDHWKSLGPTNMLDITYLDEDGLRIMRGNTATDTLFIFQRI